MSEERILRFDDGWDSATIIFYDEEARLLQTRVVFWNDLELALPKLTPRPNGDYYECLECEKIGRIHDLKKQIDQLEHDNIRFREELE